MAKTPILGLGNDGANEGYWRVQIRSERTGRWVKMGGAVKFETTHPNYGPISGVGFFVGGARAGVAYIRVENHEFIPDGTIIEVPSTDFEDVKAIIDPTPTEISEVVPPLAPPKPEVIDAPKLKAEMDGEEALSIIRKEAAKVAADDGRFPVARSAEDVEAGAKRQYAGVFETLKAENPELVEEFENYEQFWAYAKKSLAAQLTTRWADSVDKISDLTKAANRIYARDVLGMDPDGLITFYRNSINNHTDVSTAAAGYVSLDRKMAFNYNSDRENVGANGRYLVKIKPDELLGLLGYSDPTDEHGGVVGPDVTAIPGRVINLGGLRWDPLNPLMDPKDTKVGTGFGSSWFRFFSTGSTFEFPVLDANPFAEGENNNWSDFYANNGLQKGAIPGKYDELYGEGAFQRDFPSASDVPGYDRARSLFTEKDGLFAFDPSAFENRFAPLGTMVGEAGDRKDKALKFFEAVQQLSGDRFMVLRSEIEGRNLNAGIEVNPEFRSKAAGREMVAATAKDLKVGDVVQQGTEAALFGIIRAASHDAGISSISVEWADGSKFDMKMPFGKKVKVWKAEKVDAPIQWSDVNGVETKGDSNVFGEVMTENRIRVDESMSNPLSAVDADVISDDHKKAIDSYTRSSLWRTLNSYLRNDPTAEKNEKFEATISVLDDAIAENGEVFEARRVFRGQRIETDDTDSKWPEIMESLKPGDLITEQAYTSASNSPNLAFREFGLGSFGTVNMVELDTYESDAKGGKGSIFWSIDVPVGSTAFALPDGMGYAQGSEREVLLPRGSQMRVKSLKRVKQNRTDLPDGEERYNYFVEVELVPVASQEKVVDAPTRLKEIGESEVFGGLITDESIDIGSIPTAPLPSIEVDDLSDEDVQVIKFYTADGYADINDYLRTGTVDTDYYTPAQMRGTVAEIDSIIDRLGYVDSDARVFRGMYVQPETQLPSGKKWLEVLSELQVGSTISEPGFMSTSNDPGQAFRFGAGGFTGQTFSGVQNSNNRVPRTEATVFWSIDVPAGSKALSLPYGDGMLSSEEEQEVILPRGTTLRVKAIRRVTQEGTDNAYNYYIDAEVVPVVAEQKQEVVDAPTVKEFDDLSRYTRISGPLGSNDGGVYENEGGIKIYVKEPRSELHGENEVLASKLYERLGIETVEIRHGRLANGTEVTYSYWINAESDLRERLDDPVYLEKLQEGFAVDAWIANWDVAGAVFDNVVSDGESNPVRIDPGGALLFRARGEPKGGAFNDSANEIDTLADGTNPQSAEVFGSMTEEQKKKAAARLKWITPEEIEELVGSQISDPNVAESLAQTLIARRQNILERFGLDEEEEEGGWINVDGVETIGDSPLFDDGRLTDTEFEASDLGDLTPIPTDFSQTPDDQIDALLGYTREDYDSINSILRGQSLHPKQQQRFDELSKLIERIDKTFESQAPIKYGKTVFRGLIFYNPELATLFENLRPGDEYVESAYLSTSTNPLSARGFSMMRDENPSAANASNHNVKEAQGTAFLAINLPNGSKALSLSEISEHETEGEILLPRDSRLKIEGIRRVKQNRKDGAEYYNYYVEASLVSEPVKVDAPIVEEAEEEVKSGLGLWGRRNLRRVKEQLSRILDDPEVVDILEEYSNSDESAEKLRDVLEERGIFRKEMVSDIWNKGISAAEKKYKDSRDRNIDTETGIAPPAPYGAIPDNGLGTTGYVKSSVIQLVDNLIIDSNTQASVNALKDEIGKNGFTSPVVLLYNKETNTYSLKNPKTDSDRILAAKEISTWRGIPVVVEVNGESYNPRFMPKLNTPDDLMLGDDTRLEEGYVDISGVPDLPVLERSQAEKDAIEAYRGWSYLDIKTHMETPYGHPDKTQEEREKLDEIVDNLDKLTSTEPIPEGTVLYRGFELNRADDQEWYDYYSEIESGDRLIMPIRFSSTTLDIDVAENFAVTSKNRIAPEDMRSVVLKIVTGEGATGAAFENDRTVFSREKEVLLPMLANVTVTNVYKDADGVLRVEGLYAPAKTEPVDAPTIEEASKPVSRAEESKGESEILDALISGEEGLDFTGLDSSIVAREMDSLSEEQLEAVRGYTGTRMYRNINEYLNNGEPTPIDGVPLGDRDLEDFTQQLDDYIGAIDRAIFNAEPTKEDTKVFRGIPLKTRDAVANFDALKPGDVISNSGGYSSTTKRPSYGYGMGRSDLRDNAFLIINLPAGSKTLGVPDEITGGEEEVILPRRTDLKIKAVRKVKKTAMSGDEYYEYYIEVDAELPASMRDDTVKQTGIFQEYGEAGKNAVENTPLPELGFDPEEEITIYRGVPKGIKDINPGDWVTTLPQLAKDYAGDGDVISMKVKAKDLLADPSSGEGAYTEEMVYRPAVTPEPETVDAPAVEEPKQEEARGLLLADSYSVKNTEKLIKHWQDTGLFISYSTDLWFEPEVRFGDLDEGDWVTYEEMVHTSVTNPLVSSLLLDALPEEDRAAVLDEANSVLEKIKSELLVFDPEELRDRALKEADAANLTETEAALYVAAQWQAAVTYTQNHAYYVSHQYRSEFFAKLSEKYKKLVFTQAETLENRKKSIDTAIKYLEESSPTIAISGPNLLSVIKDGRFKSQFETDTSGGAYDPQRRKSLEFSQLGIPFQIDDALRPIYGYLTVQTSGPLESTSPDVVGSWNADSRALYTYGDMRVVLKKEVKSRATFTMFDSLSAKSIGQPITEVHDAKSLFFAGLQQGTYKNGLLSSDYTETQILGGVSMEDVEKIVIDPQLTYTPVEVIRKALDEAGYGHIPIEEVADDA